MGKPHEKLDAGKSVMEMVKAIYQMTSDFPTEERYGLAQQMRRVAVSIPSNIAEGAGRNGAKEYLHFIGVARGSLAELETQMQLEVMLGFELALGWDFNHLQADIFLLAQTRVGNSSAPSFPLLKR